MWSTATVRTRRVPPARMRFNRVAFPSALTVPACLSSYAGPRRAYGTAPAARSQCPRQGNRTKNQMETVSSPEEPLFSLCRKSADSPEENAEARRKQRFPTSFLRKQESSRPLDPCFRRGDGGRGHTGILQACRRTRERHFLTSFLRKQESSRPAGECRVRCCAAGRDLDPCFRRGDGG